MIYAKCIQESQIAHSHQEFLQRQNEEYPVYCVGETTLAKEKGGDLYCVPLNFIFCCLRYGSYIAIVDVPNEIQDYPKHSSYLPYRIAMREQRILAIIKADSKEAIDYIADNIPDYDCIPESGYVSWLSDTVMGYYNSRLGFPRE